MRDPLVVPLILFATGILTGNTFGFTTRDAAWPVAAFLLLGLAAKTPWLRRITTCLAILFAGAFVHAWHRPATAVEIDAGPREIVILSGCVVEPTVFSADRGQFTLEIDQGARARVSLPIEDDSPQRLAYGTQVEIEARLRKPHNYNNPGGFDYTGYLAQKDIFWTASMARGARARILPSTCGSALMARVFGLRTWLIDRIEQMYPGNDYAMGMTEAILVGETSKLDRIWTENFRRTGTFHALVISGIHVTVLAGVLLFCLRLLPVPEMASLLLTAIAAWIYAIVTGGTPPVVRAAGGFTLFLIARFFFRRTRILNLLAAVALVYLAMKPAEIFDASFQLSFLAVAALGALATPFLDATSSPLARGMRHISELSFDPHLEPRVAQWRVELRLASETLALWSRIPARWLAEVLSLIGRLALFVFEMVVVSAVIQVGLALPMAAYFHRLSITGLSSNLLIVPAMNLLVPLGFLAIGTGWNWLANVCLLLLNFSQRVAGWHAAWEPSWRIVSPPLWFSVLFIAALVSMARIRRFRWASALAVVTLFGIMLWQPWPVQWQPGMLELAAIDVGQGDSLLVLFPEGATMLIDGGGILTYGSQRRSNFDTGEDVVSPYLWSRGLQHLDVIAATHAHQDHVGGLPALLENFRPKELWTGANPPPELLEKARSLGVFVVQKRASLPTSYSGTRIEVLAPAPDYQSPKVGNNDSLAFRIDYGSRSFLLTGDLERRIEDRLLSDNRVTHADVIKVGHHGSKTSTSQEFLDAVNPSIAVISAGFINSFGHPHADVLGRLADRRATVLRTDLDGLSRVWTNGQRLWFDVASWNSQP